MSPDAVKIDIRAAFEDADRYCLHCEYSSKARWQIHCSKLSLGGAGISTGLMNSSNTKGRVVVAVVVVMWA